MKKVLLACAALILSASPALAAKWKVDPAKSTLTFVAKQSGKPFTGTFAKWDADIDYDPAKPEAASIKVTVDIKSATTADEMRDEHIGDPDWFNANAFPNAVFASQGFKKLPDGRFETEGTLNIRSIEKKVKLTFQLDVKDGIAHVRGEAGVSRLDFDLGKETDTTFVGVPVNILFDLTATAQK